MKKFIITMILLAFIFTLSIVVKNNNKEKSTELKKIKVAEVTHSIFYTPLYIADKMGYFKERGLDVEIILTSGADKVATAVMSKDVQIGFCGSEQTLYIYNKGAKDYLVNFAVLTKRDGSFIVSRNNNDTFSLNDLEGKIILGGRNGGMPAMTLKYTLHKNGINAKVDTSVDFAGLSGAFISGKGDYVTLFEPNALTLEKQKKGYAVKSVGEIGGEVPYTAFNTLKSYANDNPEVLENFKIALQKGVDYTLNSSNDVIANKLKDYFPDTNVKDIETVVKRYKDIDAWYKKINMTEDSFNHMQDIVEYNGFLEKRVDFKTLYYE